MSDFEKAEVLPARALHVLLARAAQTEQGISFLDRAGRANARSYAALHAGARAVAEVLRAAGVRRGARVALVLPTGPDFVHALFATQMLGAVAVPLYPPVRLAQIDEYLARTQAMLEAVGAQLVVTTGRIAGLLAPALRAARPPCRHLAIDSTEVARATQAAQHTHDNNAPGEADGVGGTTAEADVDQVCLLQFSSGTTAAPKAVALTPRQICANVTTIARALYAQAPPPGGRHVSVSWLPLYHDMGLMGSLLTSVYDAAPCTLMPPESFVGRPAAWLQAISRARATVSAAPNFAYALCTERVRDEDMVGVDLSTWQVALNGAEAVQMDTMRAFAERFGRWGFSFAAFTPVYGLAEATLAVSFSDVSQPCRARRYDAAALRRRGVAVVTDKVADDARNSDGLPAVRELVSVGRPLPGYGVRVMREHDDVLCAAGELGRIEVAGPSLMAGYWPISSPPDPLAAPTWRDTGDLGFVDDGELYLVGRSKDVLVVRGENVAPEELERAVDDEPEVRTGCSIAGSVGQGGATEAVVLLVEVRGEMPAAAAAEALRAKLAVRVAQVASLRVDEVVLLAPGTLPRTSSGKKRRAEALRRYENGELSAPVPPRPWRLILRALVGRARLWGHGASARRGPPPALP